LLAVLQVRQVTASELELLVSEHQYVAVFFCKFEFVSCVTE
jgi:hypothetical protein